MNRWRRSRTLFWAVPLLVAICCAFVYLWPTQQPAHSGGLTLTSAEQAWVRRRIKPIVVGVTTIPNQVLPAGKGRYKGYAIDLFAKIGTMTGLDFEYRYFKTWDRVMDAAKDGRIDVVFLAQKTPSRLGYLDFTDRVLTLQNKIIVNLAHPDAGKVGELDGSKIAVTRGSAIYEYLKTHYPRADVLPVADLPTALKMVARGEVDAVVAEPVRASYFIKKYNLDNLKIADDLGYDYNLGIASLRRTPVLSVILGKAVNAISADELEALRLKWGYVERVIFDRQTLFYLGGVFGIILLFSFYLYLTNRRLQQEIRARKEAMRQLEELLAEKQRMGEILEERIAEEVEKNRQQEIFMFQQNRLAQMGELLSMIAHQWRQPLNNLSLVNQLIYKKYTQGRLDNEMMEYFKKISKEHIGLMSKTIDDFRNFYRIEGRKEWFDPAETVERTVGMVRPALTKAGVEVETVLEDGCRAYGYENGLAQVILNLVNNARDALLASEREEKKIRIEVRRYAGGSQIVVEDTAGGVPEAIMGKIFDPYFSTKGEKNGTGLGLYMSKKIVKEQLGGELFVTNTSRGARFVIRLEEREAQE